MADASIDSTHTEPADAETAQVLCWADEDNRQQGVLRLLATRNSGVRDLTVGTGEDAEFREWVRGRDAVLKFVGEFHTSTSWTRMERMLALIIDQREREQNGDDPGLDDVADERVAEFLRGRTDSAYPAKP